MTIRRIHRRRWLALALAAAFALAACRFSGGDPTPVATSPAAPDRDRTAYILCVDTDQSQATQDRCQRDVWGQTFREDDPRWDCLHMGNRTCGPDITSSPTTTRK